MYYFVLTVLCFLAVIGALDLTRKLVFWLYKPKKTLIYVGAVINSADDAENITRSIIERLKWMEMRIPVKIILIDKTESDEVKYIVEKIIKKFSNVSLLS